MHTQYQSIAVAGGSASSRARGNLQAKRGGATDAGTAQGRWARAAPRSVPVRGAMPAFGEAEGTLLCKNKFFGMPEVPRSKPFRQLELAFLPADRDDIDP